MSKIHDVIGIGPAHAEKLGQADVRTMQVLLKVAGTKAGRRQLATLTGIEEEWILKWAHKADLWRIKGIGEDYCNLLEAAGVATMKDLQTRKAELLHAKLTEINAAHKLVKQLPTVKKVESWVSRSKQLRPAITH